MTRYAAGERAALADTLSAAGPDAPTLCAGWTTRDLAAHLVLRDRHPLAAAGILLPPFRGINARRQRRIAAEAYPDVIARFRRPPAWSPISNTVVDEAANLLEMYVHHEDVRRAGAGWQPRVLDAGFSEGLWNRLRRTARLVLRRFPATVVVRSPGHPDVRAGAGGQELRLDGDVQELTLFLAGRQAVARVPIDGPEELADRLRHARLGF